MAERTLVVRLERKIEYALRIGAGTLTTVGQLLKPLSASKRVQVITDPAVRKVYGPVVKESLEGAGYKVDINEIPQGEKSKSLAVAESIYDRFLTADVLRDEPVIALGGGVVGDLTGFVAATYMRGLPFIQLPTSLVAQVDSSIGGKVAINHGQGKNHIGSFYQPSLVLIDVTTLATLPQEEFVAGMAEVIKTGFISGENLLSYIETHIEGVLARDPSVLTKLVTACCRFKSNVIMEDERESGKRAILNYGHTIGHAVEVAMGYRGIRHGEAISLGMVAAAQIAWELGWIDNEVVERHLALLDRVGLPTELLGLDDDMLLQQTLKDKKRKGEKRAFMLLKRVGQPELVDVDEDVVKSALSTLRKRGPRVRD